MPPLGTRPRPEVSPTSRYRPPRPAPLAAFIVAAALAVAMSVTPASAQVITVPDRKIHGEVGFNNTGGAPLPPRPNVGTVEGRSIGLVLPLNSTGPVLTTPLPASAMRRNYEVIVNGFNPPGGGDNYWLTAALPVGSQLYRFGYAANLFGSPGYPNFINDVFAPNTVLIDTAADTQHALLECAGLLKIHFVEAAPGGGYQAVTRTIRYRDGNQPMIAANPRFDPGAPAASSPPFYAFRSGDPANTEDPGSQTTMPLPNSPTVLDLWVRESDQSPHASVGYQIAVDYDADCTANPACPNAGAHERLMAYFEDDSDTIAFGALTGPVSNPTGGRKPGLHVGCGQVKHLFVVVPPPCPMQGCPVGPTYGTAEGCVNLLGETELVDLDRTAVWNFNPPALSAGISNPPGSPASFTSLFSAFRPGESEGVYTTPTCSSGCSSALWTLMSLNDLGGTPRNRFRSAVTGFFQTPAGVTSTGPSFCMVPGIYQGTVSIRDGVLGVPSGAARDLDTARSAMVASSGGFAGAQLPPDNVRTWPDSRSDLRGSPYDVATGTWTVPYEIAFGNPNNAPGAWDLNHLIARFQNALPAPQDFVTGGSLVTYTQPTGNFPWSPSAWIATTEGGSWPVSNGLEPGFRIAPRADRTQIEDRDICVGTLRIEIDTQNFPFYNPRITGYTGTFTDNMGTASTVDDVVYGVQPSEDWLGSPRTVANQAMQGFIVMQLPEGTYSNFTGYYNTFVAGGTPGVTALPPIDVDLKCGQSCTSTPNALLCLNPIPQCGDTTMALTRTVAITGVLNHDFPISSAWYRINGGTPVPTTVPTSTPCTPSLPCSDAVTVVVTGLVDCRNDIEIGYMDNQGLPIKAFVSTTIDQINPVYHVNSSPSSPAFACGSEITVSGAGCAGDVPAAQVTLPVPIDNCSSVGNLLSPLQVFSTAPAIYPAGTTTTVTLTAIDACGHSTTCEVRVRVLLDTTAPTLSGVPADATVSCATVPEPPTVTCSDPSGVQGLHLDETVDPGDCIDRYDLIRTWTCFDACNNLATGIQVLHVVDNTAPTFTGVPGDVTVECDAVPGPAPVTIDDDCDPDPDLVYLQTREDGDCDDSYRLIRTWTATDRCLNEDVVTQVVTVVDTTPPLLLGVPADITVPCTAVPPAAVVTATDNCDPDPDLVFVETREDGDCPGNYRLIRTWTATDRCRHETVGTQIVTVEDKTPPVVTGGTADLFCLFPPNHSYVCFRADQFAPVITDDCSGPATWSFVGCASNQCADAPCPEYPGQNGDGNTLDDCVIPSPDGQTFCVRAERAGTGPGAQAGRRYAVSIVATDLCGNTSAPVTIGYIHVPHDESPKPPDCIHVPEVGCKKEDLPCFP